LLIDRDRKAIQAGQISSLRQLEVLLFPE